MRITGDAKKDGVNHYHSPLVCAGQRCIFHNPTEHKMRNWPMNLRTDEWAFPLIERICEHGVGHPDPDSVDYMDRQFGYNESEEKQYGFGVHGCHLDETGRPCCAEPDSDK
jgi:hypothetical protein